MKTIETRSAIKRISDGQEKVILQHVWMIEDYEEISDYEVLTIHTDLSPKKITITESELREVMSENLFSDTFNDDVIDKLFNSDKE